MTKRSWRRPAENRSLAHPHKQSRAGRAVRKMAGRASRRAAPTESFAARASSDAQELGTQRRVGLVVAAPMGRPGPRLVLSHTAHLRAEMRGADIHGDDGRFEQLLQEIGELLAHPLLHREAPRE